MLDAMERELSLDVSEKSRKKVIEVFRLSRSLQLPVLDGRKVVGLLDLFVFLESSGSVNLEELMEKDIVIAGKDCNVFSFKSTKQQILPFVDEADNYVGFVNRVTYKVYLPSKEYMQVIERGLARTEEGGLDVDYGLLASQFNTIIENNYEGLYVTIDKGKTLSINEKSIEAKGLNYENIAGTLDDGLIPISEDAPQNQEVVVTQWMQKRHEINVSDEMVDEGAIIRVINKVADLDGIQRIRGFEKLRSELEATQKLAEQYQNEIEFLRWEQSKNLEIIAESPKMKQVINLILRVAKVDSTVLIQGPSGAGKGVLSRLIHNNSGRKDGPFIKIDCGSIPESLLESELFGYEQGAFTGAEKGGKAGLVELANNGTLFLDEIGEFPINLQPKLLRLLQDREIIKIGGKTPIALDIRVIAATNRNLEEMAVQKQFRKDLFYRLNVVPVAVPPLSERKEDVGPLIEYYLRKFNEKYKLDRKLDRAALKALMDYHWPGNVRELENLIEYMVVTASDDTISGSELPDHFKQNLPPDNTFISSVQGSSLKEIMDLVEKNILIETMRKTKSTDEMAGILSVDRSTIVRKLQKHRLKTHFS